MITPACCGGVSCTHGASNVAGPTKAGSCNVLRYGSTSVLGSSWRSSSQSRAAWQAWPYWDSVASDGTSTLVVTPPGEMPAAPAGTCSLGGAAACGGVVGAALSEADEHAATDNTAPTVTVAQHSNDVVEYRRMDPI